MSHPAPGPPRTWAAATLLGVLACAPAPRPPDAELHRLAVVALREEVAAPAPLLVHPLLIRRVAGAAPELEHAGSGGTGSGWGRW